MPRKPPFTAAAFATHVRPRMAEAFPVAEGLPDAMRDLLDRLAGRQGMTITERLAGLKRLFDEEAVAAA